MLVIAVVLSETTPSNAARAEPSLGAPYTGSARSRKVPRFPMAVEPLLFETIRGRLQSGYQCRKTAGRSPVRPHLLKTICQVEDQKVQLTLESSLSR